MKEGNEAFRRERRLQDTPVIHYRLVVFTHLEFLANRFLRILRATLLPTLRLGGPAASRFKPADCTFCRVDGQQGGDPSARQSNSENPKILFPRDVVVLPS